jgi:hypothetical protein
MTTMGKILVFINLLFAVLVMALITVAFVTKTDWAAGHAFEVKEKNKAQANYLNEVNKSKELEKEKNLLLAQSDGSIADLKSKLELSEKVKVDAEAKLLEANKRVDDLDARVKQATAAMEGMKVEIKSLDDRLGESQQLILKLGLDNKKYKAEAIKATTDLQSALDRSDQLLQKLVEADKKISFLEGDAAAKAGQRELKNPPPDDIRGRVTVTDDTSGYVTINLGSDNGVSKGNTLEVYRLKPRPQYVGTMRVYDVRPNEAVGKLMGTGPRGKILKDDEVASRILGQ